MKEILPGVYHLRFGEPERFTFETLREKPMKSFGESHPAPFAEADIAFEVNGRGCTLTLPLEGHVYGFGLQLKAFEHTNGRRLMRCNADAPSADGESHAPVPFYVTTAGYGVLVDTLRDAVFYCGQTRKKAASRGGVTALGDMRVEVPRARGVDVYIFAGNSMLEAVRKYNMFAGGGAAMPAWGLGAWYRVYGQAAAADWAAMARKFRERDIPVTVIGLEPGWHTHSYSCSYVYDNENRGDCLGAVDEMRALGYRVNLWEHCFTHPTSPIYDALLPYSGDYEVWGGLVPDFTLPEARRIFTDQQKTLHADCFKLDECDGSDHTGGWSFPDGAMFPSGMDGEQMHHALGLLYQQTMDAAFPGACHSVRASGALASPYPFVLYSDLYEHRDFIRGVCTAGFSGLLWAPEVRHAESRRDFVRRLQTATFSPQLLINAWYLKNPPWEQFDTELNLKGERMADADELERIVRDLFKTRERLTPYLQRMYEQYRDTGKPVFRALVMDYPDDEATYPIDDEYLMGDDYLFAPLTAESDTRNVYLPGGSWQREETGETFAQGWHTFTCGETEYLLFKKV